MNVLITGGAGFLGARLARALLARGSIPVGGGEPQTLQRLTLTDRVQPPDDLKADPRVRVLTGDLLDLLVDPAANTLVNAATGLVFHLASAVSGECEADFELGLRSNLRASMALLESCRLNAERPVFVFASSLAVFGLLPGQSPMTRITDDTLPTPQTSYGTHKLMTEQLLADYSRKGFVRGRSTRLMTVAVRPGKPNGAASGFFSGMIREPLAGLPGIIPVGPDTPVALSSPANTIAGLLRAAEVDDGTWGARTGLNLPALQTTVGAMAAALEKLAGPAVAGLLRWEGDPVIGRIVATWPANIGFERARAMGLAADPDFESIVRAYMEEQALSAR